MADVSRKLRILRSAATLVGRKELARNLGVAEAVLEAWLDGEGDMPDSKLMPLAEALEKFAKKQPE